MKELTIIINPCSGTRKVNKYLTDIIAIFSSHGYCCKVLPTTKRGDASAFARQYARNSDLIVAIGGDGTFNEVVEGIMKSNTKTPVGYIPAGSTNDFATSAGIPKAPIKAATSIMEGTVKEIDIGKFNDRFFTYVASFGAFTKVSYTTPQNIKNALGHIAYILEGIKDIPSIHDEHLKITTDTQTFEDDYVFGAISNSTTLGGLLTIDPKVVDLSDGLLELILIKSPKNAFELNQILTSLNGKITDSNMIKLVSTSKIEIICPTYPDWTIDGEYEQGRKTVRIDNLKKAIKIIY